MVLKAISFVMAVLMLPASPAPAEARNPASGFRNPVKQNGADPFMVTHAGQYYLLYTRNDHIAISRAASVTELAAAPETVVWRDSDPARCCAMWAPELHLVQGRWYLYYSAADSSHAVASHRMHVLESAGSDPLGPYTFKGSLAAAADHYSLDGTVLKLPDGRLYAIWSGWQPGTTGPQNLYIAAMSNAWTTSGPRVLLARPQFAWEMDHAAVNEGAAALWRDGRLFLAYSASGCTSPNYALGLLTFRGGDVLDPAAWSKSAQPVFAPSPSNTAYTTAHNSFFTSPDGTETWMAYHGVTNPAGSCGGDRSTRIQRVNWRADGTPDFGVPVATGTTLALPSGDPGAQPLPAGDYVITAAHSGKALDVAEASTLDGADVLQWEPHGQANQVWRLRPLGDGSYEVVATHSGKLLDVDNATNVDGANVLQWSANGGLNQQWYIDPVGDGRYRISSKVGGRALDVDHAGTADGANVLVWQYLVAENQHWHIRPWQ